jgi:hypothetical protein
MIIAIYGLICSGKSRLVKEIISLDKSSFDFKKYKSVKFMVSKKYKLVVLGHYPEEGIYIGSDGISVHSLPQVCEMINKFQRNRPEYNIIYEGTNLNSQKLHDYIFRKRLSLKVFFLGCTYEELAFREDGRTDKVKDKSREKSFKNCKIMSNRLNPTVLDNVNEQDLAINVKIILGALNIRTKTKVK